jgi:hypothetical protein
MREPTKKINSWDKPKLIEWLEKNPRVAGRLPNVADLHHGPAAREFVVGDSGGGGGGGGGGDDDDGAAPDEDPPAAKKARRVAIGMNGWARMFHVIDERLKIEFQQRDQPL